MKQTILVTGGTGFIGSHTAVELIEAGYDVVVVDNLSNSKMEVLDGIEEITGYRPSFEMVDLRDKEATEEVFKKYSNIVGIIHFAASKAVGESVQKPLLYYRNNIVSLINLLELMQQYGVKGIIFSSSCTVYGQPKPENLPVTEDAPHQKATSPYGNTKEINEQIIYDYIHSGADIKSIILRYFNPIGAHPTALIGELPNGVPANLIPYVTQTAIGIRKELTIFGNNYDTPDGTCIRDYIYVVDLAKAHVAAMRRVLEKDADRIDYLLRDSYFTGASYGEFDLTRILRVIRPIENGIAFQRNGMHAIEDYVLRRYQMYMQVYFHPATRAMEVLLQNLLKRAKELYPENKDFFILTSPHLLPFFEKNVSLADYLSLDDGVMNTYFQLWMTSPDKILADLSQRFVNRKVFKSITFSQEDQEQLASMRKLVEDIGFDPDYYTAIHKNFDLPYDIYRPESENPRTQIEILQKNGELAELSSLSPIVQSLAGSRHGDNRFYFPKEMLDQNSIFASITQQFLHLIENDHFTPNKN